MLTATKKKGASIRPETEMLMLTAGASLITDLVFISRTMKMPQFSALVLTRQH
jgi:hypothetical protein